MVRRMAKAVTSGTTVATTKVNSLTACSRAKVYTTLQSPKRLMKGSSHRMCLTEWAGYNSKTDVDMKAALNKERGKDKERCYFLTATSTSASGPTMYRTVWVFSTRLQKAQNDKDNGRTASALPGFRKL